MKILIVEDEFMVAMTLKVLLKKQGHDVVGIADDLASALNQAERANPQIAFVDIHLAKGDSGLDVAAELQKSRVICILLTGNPPDGPRPDLALGCLPKPFSDKSLAGTIRVAEAAIEGKPLPDPPRDLRLYRL